ncbi:MAG: methyltransferase domain-containing protein [Treponemataceae bacterium]|nr:methyltransferase domain-containing protein [Treponemataceae bacterium]
MGLFWSLARKIFEETLMTDIENSIISTKQGFEQSFYSGDFYNKQTQDEHHLKNILDFLPLKADMKILDLGAGSGYLSFPIAKKNPTISIIGLDIVEKALEVNRFKAKKENIRNIRFVSYNGIDFPFVDSEFDMVISRYALHHFPDIHKSIFEVSRIIKQGGFLFISDPTPNANDICRFVDEYMQLKKDGHIKFYTKDEWLQICGKYGLQFKKSFESKIRFPRKKDTAYGFDELLKRHDKKIVEGYELEVAGDEIYITEQVNNILFYKRL